MYPFVQGKQYSRPEIQEIVGAPVQKGGHWYTGYTLYKEDFFIFCGVGTPGATGHDYGNHFEGDELVWFGKTTSKLSQPHMQKMIEPSRSVYVFYRESLHDSFTFAGLGAVVGSPKNTQPVEIRWRFRPTTRA